MPDAKKPTGQDLIREGERLLQLCNACRYCEGYCAVFPAMERRTAFSAADVNYLANLCHNCGECYYACPYTPPHEYGLNFPKVLAEIRTESYQQYTPGAVRVRSYWWLVVFIAALVPGVGLPTVDRPGDFYSVVPHGWMAGVLGFVFLCAVLAMLAGFRRFWRDNGSPKVTLPAFTTAVRDAATLTNLHGHGAGCPYPGESLSQARRWFHHLTFYGFLLCFASTSVAAFYHFFLHWHAPYPYLSLPVALGTVGGIGLLIGPAGLHWLKRQRDPELDDIDPGGSGGTLIALLVPTSATGLMLLGLRDTRAMPWLLIVHLAVVFALFVTLPYQKFVHAIYRFGALLRNAVEQSRIARGSRGIQHHDGSY